MMRNLIDDEYDVRQRPVVHVKRTKKQLDDATKAARENMKRFEHEMRMSPFKRKKGLQKGGTGKTLAA